MNETATFKPQQQAIAANVFLPIHQRLHQQCPQLILTLSIHMPISWPKIGLIAAIMAMISIHHPLKSP